MSKAEHMGVSPSQVTSSTRDHSCLKQTTPEQMCKFCAECIHSEPLESKSLLGSEAVENEPRETSIPNSEKLQAFCGDVPDSSFTDHLAPPSEDMRKSTQTNKASCSQQNTSEQKHGTELMHNEQSEQKHQLCYQIVFDKPQATSLVDNATLQPVSKDVSKSSQTGNRQALDFLSGNRCNELDVDCVHSEPLNQKHQLGSEIIQNEPAVNIARLPSDGVEENLQTISEDLTKVCPVEPSQSPPRDANKSCQAGEISCLQQSSSEQTPEFTPGISSHEPSVVNYKLGSQLEQTELGETSAGELGASLELVVKSSIEQLKQPEVPITIPSTKTSATKHLQSSSDLMEKKSCLEQSETPPNYVANNSACLGRKGKRATKSLKNNYTVRSLIGSDRVLRSRSGERPIPPESSINLADVNSIGERKQKKRNKIRRKKIVADEYSRIRTHLRYLLNRINYEQNLIDAYSSEGWKGLSVEKLKPEKELQRATSEILRRKLKIRDLFQRLDSLCAGGFPKSLFDSEGQIDSEDIYCAKCGSKDLSADNDIILCDGACDRGFHQYCLEPPLLKEDIPPDDEGWLCPGCDCKVDCIDLVNELQGTRLFITDNWEKVFPEAAAGHNQDPNFGLASDDSDDNEYDPDGSATDEQDEGDESSSDGSSSDDSDFTSTSDEVEAPADDKTYLGLSSEDSEDDEYNPDAPELDDKVTQESSSSGSDFTSDSEDLAAVLEDNRSSGNDEGAASPLGHSNGQRYKDGGNNESLNNELLSIIKPGQDGAAPVYGKRSSERLDYKKLYDETYGNVPYDSSDDESWSDDGGPRKRTKSTKEGSSASPDGKTPVIRRRKSTKAAKEKLNETENTPKRRGRPKLNTEDSNISPAKSHEGCSTPGSRGRRHRTSYRKLGEEVTQVIWLSADAFLLYCEIYNGHHKDGNNNFIAV
ncbi:hypothetical protein CISIN_1g001512mg [Citrus sinensis]|uniref:PHD-type domain-containing protein n=1 Tax=Citrus sinensis TaxID=2711 RepID=A0A067E261_CITSI|nr:hypothetical protein CISIN_1g001512mg [Citrus sinensis]